MEPIVKLETDVDDNSISEDGIESGNVEETDIEIDEEHYSINHVEVRISEKDSDPLEDTDYCPIIDEN